MSDWPFLDSVRVGAGTGHFIDPKYWTSPSDGFNGMFKFMYAGRYIRCVASDGGGWQHVSVSIEHETKTPNWSTMCHVKDLFWEEEQTVVQFHPPRSQYVNHHKGCLHLWRYTGGGPYQQPEPHWMMVGPKSK